MTSENTKCAPFRLNPWFSERVWGRHDLRPWYDSTGTDALVGEAWLTGPQCIVATGALAGQTLTAVAAELGERLLGAVGAGECGCKDFPLLVKLLFPSDKLSLQVHPNDEMAQEMGHARGKTECWYVLEAEPGATIALGVRDGVTVEDVRKAIASGTMENLMQQVPVSVGEMIFVDAGTIHAIGPGLVMLETQQTCDITFRLYDYGRPRELHLELGLRAMRTKTAAGKMKPRAMDGFTRLIEQKYFVVDRYDLPAGGETVVPSDGAGTLVGLGGEAVVQSEGGETVDLLAGQAVVLPVENGSVRVKSAVGASFVRCFAPACSYA
ncbi:MAG: class I mannose-6-phosphate isomerase [Acidobacteriaceae bacterium]|nr:class I mannose-6-phosphate isomerase [Acidobacteriaceae bacterium]